jgi:Polysaccharide biosynthesis protein
MLTPAMSEPLAAPIPPAGTEGRVTSRPSTRSETMQYGAGYVVFVAGRLLRDLAVARILGPSRFGVWGALLVYRQYSNYTDFGFTNGLGRILPRLLEDGKESEARRAMGTGWIVAMAGTVVFALAIAARFLPSIHSYSTVTLWGAATVVALMFLDKHYMYSLVVFRSAHCVGESGIWMGLLGALELALGIALTRRFGLYGLYVSVLLALLSALACMYVRQPVRGVFMPSRASFWMLLIPSLTLMGLGLCNIAIHNVDRVVILWSRGAGTELGQYQLAATLSLVTSQLPYMLMTVLVPKVFRFGRESRAHLRPYFLLPTALVAVVSSAVGLIAYVVLPDMLRWLLPKYAAASSPAGILMLGEVCFAIAMVPETLIVALDRGLQSLLLRSFVIAGGTCGSWWALSHGYGLSAVAACMCAAQAGGAVAIGLLAAHAIKVPRHQYLAAAFAPVLYVLLTLAGVSALVPSGWSGLEGVLMRLLICGVTLAPLAALPLWFFGIRLAGVHRIVGYLECSEVG